jgi:hypothetical protein
MIMGIKFVILSVFATIFYCMAPLISRSQRSTEGIDPVVTAFKQIGSETRSTTFTNHLEVNRHGGHLQGIQRISRNGKHYLILSGSSATHSYYAVIDEATENHVTSIVKIMEKPYKHAGGFQVCEHMMAIGIEDNDAKNRSRVLLFDLSDPENPPDKPVFEIERSGPKYRSTAGCIALTRMSDKWILIVGDWDTKNLDFYITENADCPGKNNPFYHIYAIETKKMDKSDWVTSSWLSYQNINLIRSGSGQLFLAGFTSNSKNEDIADLFEIEVAQNHVFHVKKVAAKNFGLNNKTKFRWGAGIERTTDDQIRIISCGQHLEAKSIVTVYE